MTINISLQDVAQNLHPKITVLGVGGSGGNAVNNMINANLEGVDFLIANTDAQALQISSCPNKIQLGLNSTKGLGAGMRPDIGKKAAEEAIQDLNEKFDGSHMLFIAAGMGGGTGTGAAPVIAKLAREKGILTVGVVTKPFHFEGSQRMKIAEKGIEELQQYVDTLLTIPNQNLFRIANEKTTFSDAFKMADDVLYAGVRGVTDLMVQPGMINLDFSDIKTVMSEMGKAMMGTGEASGEGRAIAAAEAAIANPLIDDVSLKGARGLIINITGGKDITLYEIDEAANRIKQEVDEEANIIYGTTCDDRLEGLVRVSIVATGIDVNTNLLANPMENFAPINLNNKIYKTDTPSSNELDNSKNTSNNSVSEKENNVSNETKVLNNNILENDDENINKNYITDSIDDYSETLPEHSETMDLNSTVIEEQTESMDESPIAIEEHSETINSNNEEEKEPGFQENQNNEILENSNTRDEAAYKVEEPNVRRLSLFDTLSQENPTSTDDNSLISEKSEPILKSNDEIIENDETLDQNENKENSDNEFNPEENENSELDEEFNQETEEELLDIPTFLRRQAN